MRRIVLAAITLLSLLSGVAQKAEQYGRAELESLPEAPNYADLKMWAGHPNQSDAADLTPGKPGEVIAAQNAAQVDVFFVHPTIYTGKQKTENPWNADVYNDRLNEKVDNSTIKNQATVFNGSARVYAPRYRQAHYNVFLTKDLILKQKALSYAYEDVKTAFEYYLNHWNDGRPFIIASHSQGTIHAARLIKDFVEGQALQQKLVAAYIIGMPLQKDLFDQVPPCQNSNEFGCWVTWNTYARDYYPPKFKTAYHNALSTNPLNWKIDETYAPTTKNKGAILKKYAKIRPEINDAQNHRGLLWISKPKFFGNFLFNWKRYHVADYNLFYMNIRENVATRVEAYLRVNQQ